MASSGVIPTRTAPRPPIVITESLLMLGPVKTSEVVVVELVVVDEVDVVVGAGLVVSVGNSAVVVVASAPPPQPAAIRARLSNRSVVRFMRREDKSGRGLDDGFRENIRKVDRETNAAAQVIWASGVIDMRLSATAVLVGLAVLMAACSGESDSDTTAASTTTVTPQTTTTSPPPPTTTTLFTPITLAPNSEGTVPVGASLTQRSRISTVGMGPVLVGMTVAEAEAAAGMRLIGELDPDISPDCYFVRPESGIPGVQFMVYEGRIGRVDVFASGTVTTRSGARVGMTEQEILDLFPGRIEAGLDYRADGEALVYVPVDEVDQDYRVVFEINNEGVVTGMRGGILPAVQLGEGCV